MEEKRLALGIINKFKLIKKPGSAELISIPMIFGNLHKPLKAYFKSISPRDMGMIVKKIIDDNGYDNYSPHLLTVIGSICRVFHIHCYMIERLENDEIATVKRIFVVGQKTEVSIATHIIKYLHHNEQLLEKNLAVNRPKHINPNHWNLQLRKKFYLPIYREFQALYDLKTRTVNPKTLQLKNKFIIEYLIKTFIFDFNDKDINPLYNEHDQTILDKFRVVDGKWVNKKLIWARGTNK